MTVIKPVTPWQRVFARFGKKQSEFARALELDRAKISRALSDPEGLINGRDQKRILDLAKREGVTISPSDMLPVA